MSVTRLPNVADRTVHERLAALQQVNRCALAALDAAKDLLIAAGVEFDVCDTCGMVAAHPACDEGWVECAECSATWCTHCIVDLPASTGVAGCASHRYL